jgi:hypothetical protein
MRLATVVTLAMCASGCSVGEQGSGLDQLRNLGTKRLGTMQGSVQTKWRDGNVLYLVTLDPVDSVRAIYAHRVEPKGQKGLHSGRLVPYTLGVQLLDRDGFVVSSLPIQHDDLVEQWGKGYYLVRGSRPVSESSYRSVSSWTAVISYGWELPPESEAKP